MTVYLLNLADLALTLCALSHGGVELNPLMRSIPVMVAWKTVGVGVLCIVLECVARTGHPPQSRFARQLPHRESQVARWGLRLATAVYAAICIHHFYFIFGGV